MTAIREDDDDVRTGEQPRVRAPHQRRTREQWIRILDAGVELIAEGNGTPFTIAALCERAAVAPRAVYARVDTREDLFMAAYDHGMATIADDETRLFAELTDPSAPEAIRMAVTAVSAVFERHRRFLGAVVLLSSADPEVARRGSAHRGRLEQHFVAALPPEIPEDSCRFVFGLIFAINVVDIAYGPKFSGPQPAEEVVRMVEGYLADRSAGS